VDLTEAIGLIASPLAITGALKGGLALDAPEAAPTGYTDPSSGARCPRPSRVLLERRSGDPHLAEPCRLVSLVASSISSPPSVTAPCTRWTASTG